MDVIMGMNEGGSSHHGKLLGLVNKHLFRAEVEI
jgi:hypothetical protein